MENSQQISFVNTPLQQSATPLLVSTHDQQEPDHFKVIEDLCNYDGSATEDNLPTEPYFNAEEYLTYLDEIKKVQNSNCPLSQAELYQSNSNPSAETTPSTTRRRRVRTSFCSKQILQLELAYQQAKYLTPILRKELSQILSISEKQIKVWFQNRRMKEKKDEKKQTTDTPQPSPSMSASTDESSVTMENPYSPDLNHLFDFNGYNVGNSTNDLRWTSCPSSSFSSIF